MSFKDDLDNVSGGRISNDRLYDLTKEAALAYAKQLGDELGEVYLDKWAKCQIEKITRECDKTKADYKVWNKDEKFNVSGGMPNPACFKIDYGDLTEDQKNSEHFMHWWRIVFQESDGGR